MRVKVCGICRPQDAVLASEAGADYIGVILSPGFRRSQPPAQAARIYTAAGGLRRAGVFVDARPAEMESAVVALRLDVLQLHGAEPPELALSLRRAGVEIWKAVRPRGEDDLLAVAEAYAGAADALLLDGAGAGGTGTRFDWETVARVRDRLPSAARLVVAGGLTPGNVAEAIALLRPDVVDVSSGVEAAPGEKSPHALRAFLAAARAAAAFAPSGPAGVARSTGEES